TKLQSDACIDNFCECARSVDRVAPASRVLVSASRRNETFLRNLARSDREHPTESPRSRGRARQHARRVRYPDAACSLSGMTVVSSMWLNEKQTNYRALHARGFGKLANGG